MGTPLPINEVLPQLLSALSTPEVRTFVLEAPPGAGKTTGLPPAILSQPWCRGPIYVTEPRRIAARLAAHRVAQQRGEPLGQTVGYRVRFENKTGPQTRLTYMTEGLLLNDLLQGRQLPPDSVVILDEVHERGADLDALLALLKAQLTLQSSFKLIAMSATLNAERLAEYMGPATKRLVSEGKSFPVEVRHAPKPDDRPLAIQVRSAVREALEMAPTSASETGDILVFLPGVQEIRDCAEALAALPDLRVQVLHGDLPLTEQAEVIKSAQSGRRVVLSTNVAESSLTIVGVTTVIDSGLVRSAEFDPWAGVARLETRPISQASAIQRAGRAGRVRPGQAIRLYTQAQFVARNEHDVPQMLRTDLSDLYLKLRAHQSRGGPRFDELRFLDQPPTQAWEQACQLLDLWGALRHQEVTETGEKMSRLPLAPRLARVVVEAASRGVVAHGCLAAAVLSERDVLVSARRSLRAEHVAATDSDLEERLDRIIQLVDERFDRQTARDLDLDLPATRSIDQAARSLYEQARKFTTAALAAPRDYYHQLRSETDRSALTQALLRGFVDRVGAVRGGGRDVILQTGTQATLSPHSGVTSPLLLALSMDAPGGRVRRPIIRIAARLDPDWLLDLDEILSATDEYVFDPEREQVDCISKMTFGKVVLDESRRPARGARAEAVLVQALMARGQGTFDPAGHLTRTVARLKVLLEARPDLLQRHDEAERAFISRVTTDPSALAELSLKTLAASATNLKQLQERDLGSIIMGELPPTLVLDLERETPHEVRLKGGLTVRVNYEPGKPPWIEARLQNFFAMVQTPRICGGRLPLQLHLLAPNHRAVQVTSDLEGFWVRHYPELRKQLMRRYPKHLWPEDGRTAQPPTPGKIR